MNLKHLIKETRYYRKLEGNVRRMGTKFILAKTPLKKWVNSPSYNSIYGKKIRNNSKKVFPHFIQIENTNLCNAKCIMCPHVSMKRKKKVMNQKDFEKMIKNIMKDYPLIKRITITGFGEPLLDKGIIDKIKFINENYPKIEIDIYTNASMLDERLAEELLKTKIHKINFSINGTEKTYKKMMGLNYNRTVKNILYFLKKKKELSKKWPLINISLVIVKENEKEIKDFQKFWLDKGDSVMVYLPSDWTGEHKINYSSGNPFKNKRWACAVLWKCISVDVNGDLIMCCRDFESKEKFGNLLKQGAKEVFEGNKLRNIRKKQLKEDFSIPICNKCDNSFDSSLDWWKID
jgi:radical SAM protein with 4Fe4S-binding SPASM domain